MYKNFFASTQKNSSPFLTCFYCGKKGHSASTCYFRKNSNNIKMIWVPKGSLIKTNIQGPKKIWVTKSKIWLYEWRILWREVGTLIADALNTWWEIYQILLIFLLRIVDMWLMETTTKVKFLDSGKIGMNPFISIENVLLVDGLKYSLLSVSQLCDKGFLVSFDSHNCFI